MGLLTLAVGGVAAVQLISLLLSSWSFFFYLFIFLSGAAAAVGGAIVLALKLLATADTNISQRRIEV